MANKKIKANVKNIFATQNRSKVFALSAIAIAILGYGYYINSSSEIPDYEPPAMQSRISDTNLRIKEDTLGQTQLTDDARKMEATLNNQRVVEQIESGDSKIFERKEELKEISYTPKNTLEVIEVPKVEEEIKVEVKKAQETTPIKTESKPVQAQVVESYRAPSYAQYNRQSIDALKTKMAQLNLNEKPVINEKKFEPTDFSYLAQKVKEQDSTLANNNVKQIVISPTTQNAQYFPSSRVVDDETAGTQSGVSGIVFRAGQRVAAITNLKASSLQLGPILVTLAEGEFAGAELMGTVSRGTDVLNFNFTSMWLPNEQVRVPINAIALSFDEQTVGTQTDVDNRYFRRFFLKPVLEGVAAVGQYYANDDSSTVTTNSGVVVQSKAEKSASTARKVALGSIAGEMANVVGDIDTTQIVTQDRNTPVIVMFMEDVDFSKINMPKKQETDSLKPVETVTVGNTTTTTNNASSTTNNTNATISNTNSTIELTKQEALALQGSKAAEDPKVKAAIQKALSK